MAGHDDKPHIVKYHPSASGVLASSALDLTVKIWDINKAKDLITLKDQSEQVGSFIVHILYLPSVFYASHKTVELKILN